MAERARLPRLSRGQVLRSVSLLALVAVLLGWGLPTMAGVTWAQIWARLTSVSAGTLALLLALKLLALLAYTGMFRGSLPGLGTWQAVVVNVSGTAVSQLAPAGGAVGSAATWLQCRSWGFRGPAIATSLVVTGIWNIAGRLVLPVLGLAVLLASGGDVPVPVLGASTAAAAVAMVVLGIFALVASSAVAAGAAGRPVLWVVSLVARSLRGLPAAEQRAVVEQQRQRLLAVIRTGWGSMTAGLTGWFAAYFLLFWVCLAEAGLPVAHLFAAYAVGRLLTAVAVTPGGIGITEAGMLSMLTALGADPAPATAGVLLFSLFYQLLEVPLGALAWAAWWFGPRER